MAVAYTIPQVQEDTTQISSDSLLRIIYLKDSLLLQYSIDSLATSNLLELIWFEKDSVQEELRDLQYAFYLDSVFKVKRDSNWAEFNRSSRWALRDSLFQIEEDSVRSGISDLLDLVYNDSARSPDPLRLREYWDRVVYHLGNDSTFFWIHYAENDSIGVVLKNGNEVRSAIFLTNEQADSAKVYFHGEGKHDMHMWIDENLFLTHVLRRTVGPEQVVVAYKGVNLLKIPKRKLPPVLPKYWSSNGKITFSLNQLAYSNWINGADNQMTFSLDSRGAANYKKGKISWGNSYWYRFGLIKQEGRRLFKNVDQMVLKTDLQHKAFKKMSWSANSQFDSQIFPGYRSAKDTIPISKFMSPSFLTVGGGMVYKVFKGLSVNVSPVAGKFTFVMDTINISQKSFGLKEGQRIKGEPGATVLFTYKNVLWKNILWQGSLKLFTNYLHNPQNVDFDWKNTLTLKVNKYVSTRFYIYMRYDDDMIIPFYEWKDGVKSKVGEGKRLQVQQTFGVTFTYHL